MAQVKEERIAAYNQLFEDGLHVKIIALFNDSAEKGDVLGDESYHQHIGRMIGRVTVKGHHEGDRKSEFFRYQQLRTLVSGPPSFSFVTFA